MKSIHGKSFTPPKNKAAERGNVMIYILIAIVLFAALSYTVSGMMRGGNADMIGEEKAKLLAGEILDYGRVMRQGIQQMKISNGCTDTSISFETTALPAYVNGTNTSCQLFHPKGGDNNYISPPPETSTASWVFTGENNVDNIGTTDADLIAILPNIPETICTELNKISGITAVGTDTDISFTPFTGSYNNFQTLDFAAGKMSGCLNYVNAGNNFFFYQVLVPR